MIRQLFDKIYAKDKQFLFLALLIVLIIARSSIPYAVYVFIPYFLIYLVYVSYALVSSRIKMSNIKSYKVWITLFLISVAFLWGVFYTIINFGTNFLLEYGLRSAIIKDILHLAVYSFIVFFIITFIKTKDDFNNFISKLAGFFVYLALFSAVAGLVKYILVVSGFEFEYVIPIVSDDFHTSILTDYNFYSLVIYLGAFSYFYLIFNNDASIQYIRPGMIIPLLTISVLLSSSRRGLIILILFLIIAVVYLIFFRNKDSVKINRILIKSLIYTVLSVFFVVISIWIYSLNYRGQSLKTNSCDINNFTFGITSTAYRYSSVFSKELNFDLLYYRIWGCDTKTGGVGYGPQGDDIYVETDYVTVSRIGRIKKSLEIFEQYNTKQKIIGKGFEYNKTMGDFFHQDRNEKRIDYPHNFLISSLLYSGIVGAFFIFLFGIQVILALFSKNTSKFLNSVFFLILFYSMMSGNTIFSIPVFFVLIILIIHNKTLCNS